MKSLHLSRKCPKVLGPLKELVDPINMNGNDTSLDDRLETSPGVESVSERNEAPSPFLYQKKSSIQEKTSNVLFKAIQISLVIDKCYKSYVDLKQ